MIDKKILLLVIKFQNSMYDKVNFEVKLVLARITGNFKRGNEKYYNNLDNKYY